MKTSLPKLLHIIMVVALCLGLIGVVAPARAAPAAFTFTVNTNAPMDPDTNPGDAVCHTASGKCSLYAAIQEANNVGGDVMIEFDPSVTTITFTSTSCCLPTIQRSPGTTAYTTIRGNRAVELVGPGTHVANSVGLNLVGPNVTIQGMEISNFATGIYISGNQNYIGSGGGFDDVVALAQRNTLDTLVDGIIVSGDNNTISGNTISNCIDAGINLEASADENIVGVSDGHFQTYHTHNLIANAKWGIWVSGDDNLIAGNSVSDASVDGIAVSGDGNTVGINGDEFNDADQANTLTENGTGILVSGDENVVAGNYAGVYADGSSHPNNNGLVVEGSGNHIGPDGDGLSDDLEGNVLSGNDHYGMILYGSNNTIQGNLIGLSPDGSAARGNGTYGVYVSNGAADNLIGGVDEAWQANLVAHNGGQGVLISNDALGGNTLRGNSIFENGTLGIDIVPVVNAVNPNDANDADSGPNDLQNYPNVNGAALDGGNLTLMGNLQSVPGETFMLDFYATPQCDANGYGEGKTYLGSLDVTTNSQGVGAYEVTLSGASASDYITALATNANGSTSEFSACRRPSLGSPLLVNSTADKIDDDPGDGLCHTGALVGGEPECTLRAAVMEANAVSGQNTILVPEGTYQITIVGSADNMARQGDLDLNDHVAIIGAGAAATIIDGGMLDRVFDTTNNMDIEISDLTIQNGGGSMIEGGAIFNEGNLYLLRSVVRQNDSWYGAVYNMVGGELHIEASTFYSNTADVSGGGLYVEEGVVTIVNATFSGNTANVSGGGIYVYAGDVSINNATIVYNGCDADAGDGNDGEGGGIYEWNGSVTISNTIIAQNDDLQDPTQNGSDAWDCYGAYTSGGYNMIADQAHLYGGTPLCTGFDAGGDLVSGIPVGSPPLLGYLVYYAALGPLADNGGSTPTHMPLANVNPLLVDEANPAEPGSAGACAATDQRGVIRPLDGNGDGEVVCDRGAVEYSMPTLWVHSPIVSEGQTAVFTITLQPASEIEVTVVYTAASAEAILGTDFIAANGTLNFAPGETEKTVAVTTLQDALAEGDETFYLLLGQAENAFLARDMGVGSILDDDVLLITYLPMAVKK